MAHVSHELRNPIHGASGLATGMLEDGQLPGKFVEDVKAISACCQQMERLVNDLLDLGRLRSGKLTLQFSRVPIATLLKASVTSMISLARVPVKVCVAANVPRIVILDPVRVQQCLVNGLSNAFKATKTGLVEVEVVVYNGKLMFRIRDTGPGLLGATEEVLFQAFAQQEGTYSTSLASTGLGLPIAAALVKRMGGEIHLKDRGDFTRPRDGSYDGRSPATTAARTVASLSTPPTWSVAPSSRSPWSVAASSHQGACRWTHSATTWWC